MISDSVETPASLRPVPVVSSMNAVVAPIPPAPSSVNPQPTRFNAVPWPVLLHLLLRRRVARDVEEVLIVDHGAPLGRPPVDLGALNDLRLVDARAAGRAPGGVVVLNLAHLLLLLVGEVLGLGLDAQGLPGGVQAGRWIRGAPCGGRQG